MRRLFHTCSLGNPRADAGLGWAGQAGWPEQMLPTWPLARARQASSFLCQDVTSPSCTAREGLDQDPGPAPPGAPALNPPGLCVNNHVPGRMITSPYLEMGSLQGS